jgi:hypothetical protein
MKNETAVNEKKMTNAEFDVKMDLYDSMRRQHGYLSIWSKYDVEDFDAVAFPDIKEVIYQSYWPRNDVVVGDVRKLRYLAMGDITWADLWKISEYLINKSGDTHHIFIESFQDLGDGVYELWTGS